jgi:kynureninase
VLGASPGEVRACDSTTVNLYKLVHAMLDAAPGIGTLVTDRDNFPTDRYVLEGIAAARGLELRLLDGEPQPADVPPDSLAVFSHVNYRTGAVADIAAFSGHIVWDLSHSAGALPVELNERGVELAVGCTYKYLNSGPGGPGYLYVAEALQERLRSPIQGWFGQDEQFAMERPYKPAPGIGRFLAGTPPIAGLVAVEEGAKLTAEAGIDRIREKSVAQTELIVALHDARLADLGFELGSPRDPERRGSHVSLRHAEAWQICRALIEQARVVPDFRGPDSVRLGVAPLYTRYVDVWDALDRLRGLVERGEQKRVSAERSRVT